MSFYTEAIKSALRDGMAGMVTLTRAPSAKTQRQAIITELLLKAKVASQVDLRKRLSDKGINVTQATLSRDIREMRLMKGSTGYALPADSIDDSLPQVAAVVRDFGLEVRQAQNLLVLLTTMGGAQPVAACLDYEEWSEIVGTVAGDNTVLIICPDTQQADTLRTRLVGLLA